MVSHTKLEWCIFWYVNLSEVCVAIKMLNTGSNPASAMEAHEVTLDQPSLKGCTMSSKGKERHVANQKQMNKNP